MILIQSVHSQSLPINYELCVVTIEVESPNGLIVDATGFLVHDYEYPQDSIILVTNKHVLRNRKEVFVRFNAIYVEANTGAQTRIMQLKLVDSLTGDAKWLGHPDTCVDVCAIRIKNPAFFERDPAFLGNIVK